MSEQMRLPLEAGPWTVARDGDPDGLALYLRHYSARHYRDGRHRAKFVGPGSYIVLLTPDCSALFIWREFFDGLDDGSGNRQQGINCAVFHNESALLSSGLILAAEPYAWVKWPQESRLYTLVDPRKVRPKRDPGRCFLRAGWRVCGRSKTGKLILEKMRTQQSWPM
jgi:hypothetical protein